MIPQTDTRSKESPWKKAGFLHYKGKRQHKQRNSSVSEAAEAEFTSQNEAFCLTESPVTEYNRIEGLYLSQAARSIPVPAKSQVWKEEGRFITTREVAMKQRILFCLTLALLLTVFLGSAALASNIPSVDMQLSETRLSSPKEITVTISVTNTADTDMPGPIALYDPDGNRIEDFGTPTLSAGATKTWTGTWMVTDKQLADGRIAYALAYTITDDTGVLITKTTTFYKSIVKVGETPEVQVKRTITPSTARNGQKVSVIYEISNIGGVDVTDVTIKESSAVSSTDGKIESIKAGEKGTYTFTVTMKKKSLTSRATVSYQADGKTYTETVDDATIKYGDVKLEATLKADKKGGSVGDTLKLTLTLKNTGKVDYQNVTVTDALLGTVFTGLTVEAGKTVTQEKELTIAQSCELQFTISGATASGDTVETATERVSVVAVDPAKEVGLSVVSEVDKATIYTIPAIVKFTVHVTNNSAVDAEGVTVFASGVDMYSFDRIAAGETVSFTRDVLVSTAGKFRFDARTSNQLSESVTFMGNEVQISYALPTATPSQVPIATPARPTLEQVPTEVGTTVWDSAKQVLDIGKWVLIGLSIACAALIAVGIVGRSAAAAKSGSAADHLERDGYSDYMQAVPAKKRRILPDSDDEEEPAEDGGRYMAVEPEDLTVPATEEEAPDMQEAMSELYPEAGAQEELPAQESAPEAPAEEATYRRRRRTNADE